MATQSFGARMAALRGKGKKAVKKVVGKAKKMNAEDRADAKMGIKQSPAEQVADKTEAKAKKAAWLKRVSPKK